MPQSTPSRAPPRLGPPGSGDLGPVLEFMQSLWALDHALNAASKRMSARIGVTGPQRLVVRMIGRRPGVSAGELARVLHIDPSTLTGVLRRLESRGVISRAADAGDRRRMLFHLTSRGRRIDRVRGGTVESAVRRTLRRAADKDVRTASRMLGELAAELWELAVIAGRGPSPPRRFGRGRDRKRHGLRR